MARYRIRVQYGKFGILQYHRGIEFGQIDLPHGPTAKTAFGNFFVVEQHHIGMALVADDLPIQVVDLVTTAFNGLQINAAAITKNACDAIGHIVFTGNSQDGVCGRRSVGV